MRNNLKLYSFFALLLLLGACNSIVQVQDRSLYNELALVDSNEIDGFKAVYIFNNDYDKSVWVSPEVQCVQMATEKLKEFNYDHMAVIRAYFGIPEKKVQPIKSVNQEIYKQLRYKLDSNMRNYQERVEKGEAKKI